MKKNNKRRAYNLGMIMLRALFIFGLGSVVILFMYIQYYRTHPDAESVNFLTVLFAGFFEASKEGMAILYTLGLYFSVPLYISTFERKREEGMIFAFARSFLSSLVLMLAVGFVDLFVIAGWIMKMDGVPHIIGSAVHIAIVYGILVYALFLVFFGPQKLEEDDKLSENRNNGYYSAFEAAYHHGAEYHERTKAPMHTTEPGASVQISSGIPLEHLMPQTMQSAGPSRKITFRRSGRI